jgi:hypothetical protein
MCCLCGYYGCFLVYCLQYIVTELKELSMPIFPERLLVVL